MKSDLADIQVQFQTQTEKAVCVRAYEGATDSWVPKSACEIDGPNDPPRRGDIVTLTASQRLLEERGLV